MPEGCNNPYISIYLQSASDQLKPHSFRILEAPEGAFNNITLVLVQRLDWIYMLEHKKSGDFRRCDELWKCLVKQRTALSVAVGGDVSCQFLWPFISKFHGGWIDGCAGLVVAVGPSFSRMQAQWARVGRSRVDGFSWRTTGDADAFMVPQISFIWKTYSW